MKTRKFIVSLMALALASGTTFAADVESVKSLMLSGELSGYGGWASVRDPDDESDDTSYLVYGGSGVLSVPLGDVFSVQGDVLADRNDVDQDTAGVYSAFGYGGHLSFRDPDIGLLGVFGGMGESNYAYEDMDQDVSWYGVEAQYYLGSATLYAQAGENKSNSTHDALDYTSLFARGAARYFIGDNLMLQADLQYTRGTIHDDDMDAFGWGLKAKYRFEELPLALTAEYRGTDYDGHGQGSATEHVGLLGVSIAFGASSLIDQDRYGATLETPNLVVRAPVWTGILD